MSFSTLVVGLSGCGPSPLAADWPEARPLVKRAERGHAVSAEREAAGGAPSSGPSESAVHDAEGELTLRRSMALTLARSPALAGFSERVRAAEARMLQAGLWPNPRAEFEAGEFGGTGELAGTDAVEMKLSLVQTFPLGGDLERRRELAGYKARLAGWDYEAARLDALTEVTRRYIAALAAERRLELARAELELAERTRRIADRRVEAGAAPVVERARAAVPVATAQVELRRAERNLKAARRRLALSWNGSPANFDELAGDLEALPDLPGVEALVARINQNPEVARWATRISKHRAERRLAEAEAVPDVTGRAGVARFNAIDETGLVVGVSLPLPIFDRRQGDILAANREAASARERRRAAELRIEAMLSEAYARLASAHDEANVLKAEALPPAERAFSATRRAFDAGNVDFIDLLDAQRTLVELRRRRLDALSNFHTAATAIEGLIGQSLRSVGASSTDDAEQDHSEPEDTKQPVSDEPNEGEDS